MNNKKDIFLEGKLHIPLVAQFGIKNAAIAVQLGRILYSYNSGSYQGPEGTAGENAATAAGEEVWPPY